VLMCTSSMHLLQKRFGSSAENQVSAPPELRLPGVSIRLPLP
jgi:hypothetical protein